MKYFEPVSIPSISITEDSLSHPIKRRSLFARFIEALHVSRRRQAQHFIRRHRHLVAPDFHAKPTVTNFEFNEAMESNAMPTDIRRPSSPKIGRSQTPRLTLPMIAITIAFAFLHLVSGVMVDRSHASPAMASPAFAALDDDATCSADTQQPKPALPYD